MISPVVKSLLLLTVVSTCVSIFFATNLLNFSKWFILISFLQVVAYNIYQQVVIYFTNKLLNERISEYSKQGVEVLCPCARAIKSFIPIQLNSDNSYKCLECAKNIAVNVEVKTFLETQPVDLEQSTDNLNKIYNTISQQTQDGDQI